MVIREKTLKRALRKLKIIFRDRFFLYGNMYLPMVLKKAFMMDGL